MINRPLIEECGVRLTYTEQRDRRATAQRPLNPERVAGKSLDNSERKREVMIPRIMEDVRILAARQKQ